MTQIISFALSFILCCSPASALRGTDALHRENAKFIAITFDDGPDYNITPRLLNALRERGVNATFFMVGKWTHGKEKIILQAIKEGHQIGCHTHCHRSMLDMTDEEIIADLALFSETMYEITGRRDFMLRPPFGFCDERVLSCSDAPVILWDVDPAAGRTVPARDMVEIIVQKARDGSIVLMHDTTEENLLASIEAIDRLLAEGFELVTVEELFSLRGVTPEPGCAYRSLRPAETEPGQHNI